MPLLLLILVSLAGQTPTTGFRTARPIEFHLAEEARGAQLIAIPESQSPRVWYVHREVQLDDRDIADARVTRDEYGLPAVNARLTADGLKKLNACLAANVGKILAVVAGDRVLMAPMIEGVLTDNEFRIAGRFTKATAEALAKLLNHGRNVR